MYETELTKRKREKKDLFIWELGKSEVVAVENQTSPIREFLMMRVIKKNFFMKYWLLQQHMSEFLYLSSCYVRKTSVLERQI